MAVAASNVSITDGGRPVSRLICPEIAPHRRTTPLASGRIRPRNLASSASRVATYRERLRSSSARLAMPLSYSANVRMLKYSLFSSTPPPQDLTLGAPFGAISEATTFVSISQPITVRHLARRRRREKGRALPQRDSP